MSSLMQRAERRLLRLQYSLRHQGRHKQLVLEQIDALSLLILPEVMNPCIFRSGEYFAGVLEKYPIEAGDKVLDMGCGSGIMALVAARRAQRVLAVDINPAAVRCTSINALLNNLEARIEVKQSNLFSAVPEEQFDLVLFNPPFFRGRPKPGFDQAWRSEDTVERFVARLRAYLRPDGTALLVLSSDGDTAAFLGCFAAEGYSVETIASRRFLAETFTVFGFRHRNKE